MKKTLIALAAAMIAAPASADTIKIGLGIPMTGDYAPYSEWQGARCMAEMINNKGGVNGMKIEVLTQDSGADTQTAISLAQKFL
ncbi:MAG: ABC transporter substrate-binding protein, partial [Rhodobacteraceae bacterium]|nr:ABC transporter substrate-binding protein [Paracoccaceae bacterium]